MGNSQAQQTRGVVDIPVVDNSGARAVAGAVDQAGKALVDFSVRLQKSVIDRSVAEANIGATNDLDKLKRKLSEGADDPITFEATYTEESDKIINTWAQKVPMGGRDMWLQRAKQDQLNGTFEVRNLQRTRQLESEQAKGLALHEVVNDSAGDLSISAEAYQKINNDGRTAAADALAARTITQPEYERRMIQLDDALVVDNTVRFDANISELVAQGRVAEAEALYQTQMGMNKDGKNKVNPEVLMNTKKGLASATLEVQAIESSDTLWAAAKGDLGRYNEMVAGVQDVPKRLKMEARGITLANQVKAAKNAEQDAMQQDLFKFVVGGGTIEKYSPAKIGAMEPERLGSIRAFQNARDAEKGMTAEQKAELAQRSKRIGRLFDDMADTNTRTFMAGYDSWSPQTKMLYDAMDTSEQIRVDELVRKTGIEGRSGNAVSKLSADLTEVVKRWAPPEWRIGSDANPENLPPQAVAAKEMIRDVAQRNALDTGGKPLSDTQLQDLVIPIFRKLDDKRNWMEIPQVQRGAWAGDVNSRLTASGMDNALWEDVKAAIAAANGGYTPSNDEVMSEYIRMGGKLPAGWN